MIFDHIGLFVRDLESGRRKLGEVLPIAGFDPPVDDAGLKVRIQFAADTSGVRYELVAPFGEGDPVSGVLDSGKAILNHVAYRTADLGAEVERLRAARALPLGPPAPAVAFGGRRIIFLLTPLGFILELIETP